MLIGCVDILCKYLFIHEVFISLKRIEFHYSIFQAEFVLSFSLPFLPIISPSPTLVAIFPLPNHIPPHFPNTLCSPLLVSHGILQLDTLITPYLQAYKHEESGLT